jgi:hypothetical protein
LRLESESENDDSGPGLKTPCVNELSPMDLESYRH